MSTQSVRGLPPIRGYRRRKSTLNLDLNSVPPGDNREQEGASTHVGITRSSQPRQQESPVIPTPIDVEAIDDDVVESSRTAFAEAKNNRRNHSRRVVVDVDSEEHNRGAHNNQKRRRTIQNQNIINCEFYINLESSGNSKSDRVVEPPPPPPPPPKEPTFSCPICMGPMVEEMSTKCGHIFCKGCIKAAIAAQAKCPTCRKRVTSKELIRVFLPATSSL